MPKQFAAHALCLHPRACNTGVTPVQGLQHSSKTDAQQLTPAHILNKCMPAVNTTEQLSSGLDPTWEESFEFDVADENTTKCFVKFMMGAEGEEKQIGDQCECRHPVCACVCPECFCLHVWLQRGGMSRQSCIHGH